MPSRETLAKIEYYKKFSGPFGIGLVVIALAVAGVLWLQRGAHLELKGSVLKVRTTGLDDNSSLAVIDFRFVNASDVTFVVRTVDVTMESKDGKTYNGFPVPEVDAKRVFEFYPVLGQKYNNTLLMRDKIPPRGAADRMIAARFEIPIARLDARKMLRVRIEDVDGPVSELVEKQ
jgi:hypothetical protein